MEDFQLSWKKYADRCETFLQRCLKVPDSQQDVLDQAMAYSVLSGGKRLRAILVYACGQVFDTELTKLDAAAGAVELVHAYSLIHDDLPAMDDDILRRGKPTCHVQFGEATAILAGDALQSKAFEILANQQLNPIDAERRSQMILQLAIAIGYLGMAGGQSLDMQANIAAVSYDDLVQLHSKKTGALITASVILGCLAGEKISDENYQHALQFAQNLGLAFQVVDDILDYTGDSEILGKSSGADEKMNKATYVSVLGIERAQQEARQLIDQSIRAASNLGDNNRFLQQLAEFVITRKY